MKIPRETVAALATILAPHDTPERRARYHSGDFPRADKVNDIDKRYRWDLYWEFAFPASILTDDVLTAHVDTALRRIVPPLCPAAPGGLWCECPPDSPWCRYDAAAEENSRITREENEAWGRAELERLEDR